MTQHQIEIKGLRIAYERAGQGPALVLLRWTNEFSSVGLPLHYKVWTTHWRRRGKPALP